MNKRFRLLTFCLCLFSFCSSALALELWISPSGLDSNSGSSDAPMATLRMALRRARTLRYVNDAQLSDGVTIHLQRGVYPLCEAVTIRPEDSGTPEWPTRIVGEPGSVLSGGVRIEGWRRSGRVWVADVPDFNGRPLDFRQLWVDGQKAVRARDVADLEQMHRIVNNDPDNQVLWVPTVAVKRVLGVRRLEMVLHQMWCVAVLRVRSIEVHGDSASVRFHNPEGRIQFEHPWPRPMVTSDGHNSAFYLTNARELLDSPGEWFHDIDQHKLYYMPRPGEDMTSAEVIVPAVETLVQVEGVADAPVHDVRFEQVTFAHSTWMRPSLAGHVPLQAGMYLTEGYQFPERYERPDGNHPLDNQGWLGRAAAAVRVQWGCNIDFDRCTFTHLGYSGLDYEVGTEGGLVSRCSFTDIAGNGLVAGSFSPSGWETHLPYDPVDRREVCRHLQVSDCQFRDVTNEDWGCVAICAGYVSDVEIAHNEICEVSYTGISLGWGWNQTIGCMRNNRVWGNLIHHYAKHMYDVAGIYTLGAQPKSSVYHNVVHSIYAPGYAHDPNHWFYLYTDEGSSGITVRDNWTEGEKFLQNANGPNNLWMNNGPMVSDSIRTAAGIRD